MTRETNRAWRPIAVWTAVTAAATAAAGATPGAWEVSRAANGPGAVTDLLVAACATGLALALAWLWVITSVTVVGVLTGRARAGGGVARRLVLVACGAAVLAGSGGPALAADSEGSELLVGLTLPERAVAPPQRTTAPAPSTTAGDDTHLVRSGDSLWSIARTHPDGSDSVDHRWRAIWRANRAVVGDDPDLILPGQVLRLPGPEQHHPHPDQHSDEDGDR